MTPLPVAIDGKTNIIKTDVVDADSDEDNVDGEDQDDYEGDQET